MSANHPESVHIDKIDFSKINYLTGVNVCSNIISNSDFNLTTGKPLNNIDALSDSAIDPFFLNTVNNNFAERSNVHNDLIYQYPKLLETETTRDLTITDETAIETVFILEGASMQNMFGYYMYETDLNGDPQLLSTDNENNTGGYYYTPTVIFPHVFSESTNPNSIQKGDKRKLKGNLPNGNFKNISVGFFLIPHGWYAYKNAGPIYDDGILYSTVQFNPNEVNSEYKLVADKIYSVYFKAVNENDDELLLIGFEDIFFKSDRDLDYNDCMVGFVVSDVTHIIDYDKFCKIEVVEDSGDNNLIFMDGDGEYVALDTSLYDIPSDDDWIFERHMYFDNKADRDEIAAAYGDMHNNYNLGITTTNGFGEYKLITKHLFRTYDMKNCERDGKKKKLYLFESKYDREDVARIERYQKSISKILSKSGYKEKYRLALKNKGSSVDSVISLNDSSKKPKRKNNKEFRITGNGVMDCANGKAQIPTDKAQIYKIYKRKSGKTKYSVSVEMGEHPDGYKSGEKYFLKRVSFKCNKNTLVVDLGTHETYILNDGDMVPTSDPQLKYITIGPTVSSASGIDQLKNVFKNDPNAYFRAVVMNETLTFYCIRLPGTNNIPTAVYLDNRHALEWNDKHCTLSKTYFNKNYIYEAASYGSSSDSRYESSYS